MPVKSITDLEPKLFWKNFVKICEIPHPSFHEEQLSKYIADFGEKLGLKTMRDKAGNVIIKKPAASGMENRRIVILQSHLDMVAQKNSDVKHDFLKDPLKLTIEGEWVTAQGTTLGADDGVGVAATLAILESKDIRHGPIEAVFTTGEEVGFTGAHALSIKEISGSLLLNLDSGMEGRIFIGCAGGIDTLVSVPFKKEKAHKDSVAYKLSVLGLHGGHSGSEIHVGYANAIKVLNRILWHLTETTKVAIADINGGGALNAIPREAHAIIVVSQKEIDKICKLTAKFSQVIAAEFSGVDPNLKIELKKTKARNFVIDKKTQHNLLNAIFACQNGVLAMSQKIAGLVETSSNIGRIELTSKFIKVGTFQRSSVESQKIYASNLVKAAFQLIGGKVTNDADYPGWNPNPNSELLKIVKNAYKTKFGKNPSVAAGHFGLECSLFLGQKPDLDIVSFGPTIEHEHSPNERVNVKTVEKYWELLLACLRGIPNE